MQELNPLIHKSTVAPKRGTSDVGTFWMDDSGCIRIFDGQSWLVHAYAIHDPMLLNQEQPVEEKPFYERAGKDKPTNIREKLEAWKSHLKIEPRN